MSYDHYMIGSNKKNISMEGITTISASSKDSKLVISISGFALAKEKGAEIKKTSGGNDVGTITQEFGEEEIEKAVYFIAQSLAKEKIFPKNPNSNT